MDTNRQQEPEDRKMSAHLRTHGDFYPVDPAQFKNVPELKADHADIFVLGIATSGKSAFLSGLLYYGSQEGKLLVDNDNKGGFEYAGVLKRVVALGTVIGPTPVSDIQYISCDLIDSQERKRPANLLEMSGELFEDAFAKTRAQIEGDTKLGKLAKYLFNPNPKTFFLVIDSSMNNLEANPPIDDHFHSILQFLDKEHVMDHTVSICILLSKWDVHENQSEQAKTDFINLQYKALIKRCKDLQTRYDFEFVAFPFSLGQFDEENSYKYDETDSRKVFNWLSESLPYKQEVGGEWLTKFFK